MQVTQPFASRARRNAVYAAALLALGVPSAHAAFFQLAENSPAGLGNAFAGGAAIAEDASTVWFNPAGLTRIPGTQLVVGGYYIQPSVDFKKTSATTLLGTPMSGGEGGNAGESAFLPNFYLSHAYSNGFSTGLGVNVPFGLATDYGTGWVGRYYADRSEIRTINVNPAVGYKINETFSVGAGLDYQKMDAELSQAIDFGTICTANGAGAFCGPPSGNDGQGKVTADDSALGWNLGFLWQLREGTRLGMHYRSKLDYNLDGNFDITVPTNAAAVLPLTALGLVDSKASADVTLPATLSLSAFSRLNAQWAVMGDITRTYWSDLPELRIDFTGSAQPDSVVRLDLEDVYRYAVGTTYSPGGAWLYRFGLALDQTPTPNATVRTPRLPDEDRTWIALGAGYKASNAMSFDVSYAYLMIKDAKISKTATVNGDEDNRFRGNLAGEYQEHTQILSAQARWNF